MFFSHQIFKLHLSDLNMCTDNDPSTASGDNDEPIAASHKGPIMVYISKASSNGEGAVWTKIYEDGLTNGKWAVDKFIANKGAITIDMPNIEPGDYLIRPEIIALHEGNREKGAQFYNGCGQIKVTGSGTAALPATGVDMTKVYSATDPGVLFNIYGGATSYPIPGPKVWNGASSGGNSGSSPATPTKPAASPVASPKPTNTQGSSAPPASKPSSAPPASKPSAGTGSGSGSATPKLPETFTLEQFISWLKTTAGSSSSKNTRRAHARAFQL